MAEIDRENETSSGLSPDQERGLAALMTAGTVRGAARLAGVSERTLFRWLSHTAFQNELRRVQNESITGAISKLADASGDAALLLHSVVKNPATSDSAKIRAAETILKNVLPFLELGALMQRVEKLEAAVEARNPNPKP